MTPQERRVRLQAILDRHDDVARAFHRTRLDIEATQNSLEAMGRTVRDMSHAIGEAADAMLAANRAVAELFNDSDLEERQP